MFFILQPRTSLATGQGRRQEFLRVVRAETVRDTKKYQLIPAASISRNGFLSGVEKKRASPLPSLTVAGSGQTEVKWRDGLLR